MLKKNIVLAVILIILVLVVVDTALAEDTYRLNVDDRVYISVWGHEDLQKEVLINPDGEISFPLLGEIKAEGLKVRELRELVTEKLKHYINISDSQVDVALLSYKKRTVIILGEVRSPGTYQIDSSKRIMDVISVAGGLTEAGDLSNLRLTRDEEPQTLNLDDMLEGRDSTSNLLLQDGDIIRIPKGKVEVTILGSISSPGRYSLKKGLRLSDLLAQAGDLGVNAGDSIEHISGDSREELRVDRILDGEEGSNPMLKDGDTIYIPRGKVEVTILGSISSPGRYSLKKGLRLSDLLAQAGDLGVNAGDSIEHISGDSREELRVDRILDGEEDSNPILKDGDTIYISQGMIEVTVLGRVGSTGRYELKSGLRLSDLLAQAGDLRTNASSRIEYISGDSREKLRVNRILSGEEGSNPVLKDGDTIYAPRTRLDWERIFFFVSGFSAIKSLLGL